MYIIFNLIQVCENGDVFSTLKQTQKKIIHRFIFINCYKGQRITITLKLLAVFLIAAIPITLFGNSAFAGWLIFHKPAFRGKVIDAETKEPIEGTVVVAVYEKHVYGLGTGGYQRVVKVKETLTDKNGKFFFPAFSTIINPFSREYYVEFIIYKPGYGDFPRNRISPPSGISLQTKEKYFLAENFGKKGKVKVLEHGKRNSVREVTFGLVELPPLKTRKERLRAAPGGPTDFGSKELPLLFKAINDERIGFGLKPVGRSQR